MKNIFLLISFWFCSISVFANLSISKSASLQNAMIGDSIVYTIDICGLSNLNQLDSIVDIIDPNLLYLGTDLYNMPMISLYPVFCNGMFPNTYLQGNVWVTKFPNCNVTMSGCFSFHIYTKVSPNACDKINSAISNSITLFDRNSNTYSSNISQVNIISGVPWILQKNFLNFNNNTLVYDVRLSSMQGGYDEQILFDQYGSPMFTDTFDFPTCIQINEYDPLDLFSSSPSIEWIDEVYALPIAPSTHITPTYQIDLINQKIYFSWSLPNISLTNNKTWNAYRFLISIPIKNCSCSSETFALKNKVWFNAFDLCDKHVSLSAESEMPGLNCKNNSLFIPKDTLCVKKEFIMDDGNTLGMAMNGCSGKYKITITNCSNWLDYTQISFKDYAPQGIVFDISNIIVNGVSNPSSILSTSSTTLVDFLDNAIYSMGQQVEIIIPFLINGAIPESIIENCVEVNILGNDISTSVPFTFMKKACVSFTIAPARVVPFLEKRQCNSVIHNCGTFTSKDFIPGDPVEYMLHFFNYGTIGAQNIVLTDNIPTGFTLPNGSSDIHVYRTVDNTSYLLNLCDVINLEEITDSVLINYNLVNNSFTINFGNNSLKPFTCVGVEHYFVKINTIISPSATNGLYNNAFKLSFDTLDINSSTNWNTDTKISNVVSTIVNIDNLVMSTKKKISNTLDCNTQRDVIEYEIIVANMGQLPILFSAYDHINVPSPLSLIGSISNVKYCKFINTSFCTPTLTFTSGLSISGNTMAIIDQTLNPCEVMVIHYKVTVNLGLLPIGANNGVDMCNELILETGFPSNTLLMHNKVTNSHPLTIRMLHHPYLLDNWIKAKNENERISAWNLIKSFSAVGNTKTNISKINRIQNTLQSTSSFNVLTRDTLNECYNVTSCINGIGNACYDTSDSHLVSFKIDSVSITGIAYTRLNINTSNAIRSIKYVLSDIRMVRTCPRYSSPTCIACSTNLTGLFFPNGSTSSIGSIPYRNTPPPPFWPSPVNYREKNLAEWYSAIAYNLYGVNALKQFKLPISTLQCEGRLEFVITVIITYDNCSICYVSDAFKYNAHY